MKHNQHKTRHNRTTYERVRGNPWMGGGGFIALGTISAKEAHENLMPDYCKFNKKDR